MSEDGRTPATTLEEEIDGRSLEKGREEERAPAMILQRKPRLLAEEERYLY